MNLREQNQKKFRKQLRKIDERIQFDAQEFMKAMYQRPFRERAKIAWRVLWGMKPIRKGWPFNLPFNMRVRDANIAPHTTPHVISQGEP